MFIAIRKKIDLAENGVNITGGRMPDYIRNSYSLPFINPHRSGPHHCLPNQITHRHRLRTNRRRRAKTLMTLVCMTMVQYLFEQGRRTGQRKKAMNTESAYKVGKRQARRHQI